MANTAFTNDQFEMTIKVVKPAKQIEFVFTPNPNSSSPGYHPITRKWTRGVCPNCGFTKADVDPDGIAWCPACGYSQKGCYT